MAGPDFLSTHRQRRRRRSAPIRKRSGAVGLIAPVLAIGFFGTLAALQLPALAPAPVGADGVPIRVVSAADTGWDAGGSGDVHAARFGFCHAGGATNCVVDGDTFWFAGDKYRIADIDTPETHPARCAEEAALGAAATERLQRWLNDGAFSMAAGDRDVDRYGRRLRVVTRGGASIGDTLIGEGLARRWDGARRPWC